MNQGNANVSAPGGTRSNHVNLMLQSTESLSQDNVFNILSDSRRRYILYYLRKTGEPVELGKLAEELAAWENEIQVGELTKQQRKRVYVSLYQTHIQKLAEAGIIEYDPNSGLVSLDEQMSQIEPYVMTDQDANGQQRWQGTYILLAAVSTVVYALVALDVSVFGLVSEPAVGSAILIAFASLVGVHLLHLRREGSNVSFDSLVEDQR